MKDMLKIIQRVVMESNQKPLNEMSKGMSALGKARDTEESDRDYIMQKQAKAKKFPNLASLHTADDAKNAAWSAWNHINKYKKHMMSDHVKKLTDYAHDADAIHKAKRNHWKESFNIDEAKHTHIVHLAKNQHGSWGSTEIGSKTVKIHVPGDDKLGVEYHASQAASKAGYKRLRNGDSVSHSVSKIEKIGESVQIDELSKKTLGSYIRKAHSDSVTRSNHRAQDVADRRDYGYKSGNITRYDKRIATADRKLDNREVGTRRAVKRLTKEETLTNLLMKALSEGRGRPRKDGSASEEDSADGHILMQLRKTITLRGQKPIKFHNGETYGIHPAHAYKAMDKYSKIKNADDKESFVKKLGHSRGSFFQAMQEEYEMITEAPKWSNMYLSDFKNHAKEEGHTITRSNPHGRGNGNLYTSTDNNSNIHGKFDDFTQSGYYHGRDGRNKSLNRKKL